MSTSMKDITKAVSRKVQKTLGAASPIGLSEDLTLYGIDSFQLIQIIVEMEHEHNLSFDDNQLILENFNTIENIALHLKEQQMT
ncbi:acyl carrier protein [Paenibacillus pasadenensis]|uniref:acyl carrier protein n=1 Tax=Paenibacillus pasadenensis TaxID=217090 RepID=UPI0020408614|nr:acyl carrier protein [Paenibacillus pasadenensis]MCM3749539.1 acyl carrier protein [Paenibacillus pasadenensis]